MCACAGPSFKPLSIPLRQASFTPDGELTFDLGHTTKRTLKYTPGVFVAFVRPVVLDPIVVCIRDAVSARLRGGSLLVFSFGRRDKCSIPLRASTTGR